MIDPHIKAILNRARALQNEATKEFLVLVDELRERILLTILDAREITPYTVNLVKQVVAQLTADYNEKYIQKLSEDQRKQFVKGIQIVDSTIDNANLIKAVPYLSEDVLRKSQALSGELITGLTDKIRTDVNRQLSLAVMGQKTAHNVIEEIGGKLNTASVFGSIKRRAELIYRTEMNRTQTLAGAERIAQLVKQYPDLKKKWIHSHVGMPRMNHMALDGEVIPANEMFELQGNPKDKKTSGKVFQVYSPYDTQLPASETVNCRCKVIAVFPKLYRKVSNQPTITA
jgi:hypothetical protein